MTRARIGRAAFALVVLAAGCGDSSSPVDPDVAGVYAAVIRHVAGGDSDELPDVVFVEPLPGSKLSLPDQAKIVKALDDVTEVRFIDDRAEAVDENAVRSPVRRHGVLVQLGAPEAIGDATRVKAVRYVAADDEATVCVHVQPADRTWRATGSDC